LAIQALAFKAIRRLYPDYPLWRDFAYEYERGKLAIDVHQRQARVAGMGRRRLATPQDMDALALRTSRLVARSVNVRY
jgi:hypothetical protein